MRYPMVFASALAVVCARAATVVIDDASVAAANTVAAANSAASGPDAARSDEIPFDYSCARPHVERGTGGLNDGSLSTGACWHLAVRGKTDFTLELHGTYDIDEVQICAHKANGWHIVYGFEVFVDRGDGEFPGPPVRIAGWPRTKGGAVDATCSNYVFRAVRPGTGSRILVRVESDAHAYLTEFRVRGRPVRSAARLVPSVPSPARAAVPLENAVWKIEASALGGRLVRLRSKAFGFDLTDAAAGGAFAESVWDRPQSRGVLAACPYATDVARSGKGRRTFTAVGNVQAGGIEFLQVEKRCRTADASTALGVSWKFTNLPDAMSLQHYAPEIAGALGVVGKSVTCLMPTERGIVSVDASDAGREHFEFRPTRGWLAVRAADGTGFALTMPYAEIQALRVRGGAVPEVGFRLPSVALDCGSSHAVAAEVLPFAGLTTVSGAGGGFVGALADGRCTIVASRTGEVTVEDGDGRLIEASLPGASRTEARGASGATIAFARPGEVKSFATTARTVVLKQKGREVCRLEAPPEKGRWTMKPIGARRLPVPIGDPDLTVYTNFPHQASAPAWGKPLGGRRLRVGILTGEDNLMEIGRLSDRFDFDYRLQGVGVFSDRRGGYKMGNPRFRNGDHFSAVGIADVERGILKVLDWPSDVLLIGGLTKKVFGEKILAKIRRRAEAGTGIVWVGPKSYVPDLPEARLVRLEYPAYDEETWCGSGGITPVSLGHFLEDRAPAVEASYARVAEALLKAAGRTLPVRIARATVTADRATFAVASDVKGKTVWQWTVRDPFDRELAHGEKTVDLGPSVTLDGLGVPAAQGPLELRLVVRSPAGESLAWGAWPFEHAPRAALVSLKTPEKWYREGDELKFEAGVTGETDGMTLAFELVDSFGRTLARQTKPAAAKVAGTFALANALPARTCVVEARLLERDGTPCARRHVSVRVCPGAAKRVWDDFIVGVWANLGVREYLWPDLGAAFRAAGVSTLVSNSARMQGGFAMQENLEPTYLTDAGLYRCAEPAAYAKTGDKMTLVRPHCLTSARHTNYVASIAREIVREVPRLGARLVWFGDELSLTGYAGQPIDFCFAPSCLAAMRGFLRTKYGTLARLNAEWETAFKTWDEVVPFTRQEVWAADGRHVAGWSDHLEFMDTQVTNSLLSVMNRARPADPFVRYMISGTQRPSAYGGLDWWKLVSALDGAMSYGVGGQHEIHRSFRPDGGFMPWSWGYSRRGDGAVADLWRSVFHGCRGLMGFQWASLVYADGTDTRGMADTRPAIRRMVEGTGRHFVQNLVPASQIAVLYSQASYRAAFIEKRREAHDDLEEGIRKLLCGLGYAYDYVSYDQLARFADASSRRPYQADGSGADASSGRPYQTDGSGADASSGRPRKGLEKFRVLVLPDAAAMSDGEIAGLRAFVAKGGAVVSYGTPARLRETCVRRARPALDDLFAAGTRHTLVTFEPRFTKALENPLWSDNRALVAETRQTLVRALAKGGVTAERLRLTDDATGDEILNAEFYPKRDAAGHPCWCVNAAAFPKSRIVKFAFPRPAWTYDLVSGRAFGRVGELKLSLGARTPYALAQFPEEVALAAPQVEGATLKFAFTAEVDGVVRVRLYRPDGTEAACYAKNVTVKAGRGTYTVPFALSDPKGTWRAEASSVFDTVTRKMKIGR